MNLSSPRQAVVRTEQLVYWVIAVAAAVVVGYVLYLKEAHPAIAVAPPLLFLAMACSRRGFFWVPMLLSIFGGILAVELYQESDLETFVGLGALIAIAAASRGLTSSKPGVSSVSRRLNYTPPTDPVPSVVSYSAGHAATAVLVVIGWVSAGMLCRQWSEITVDPQARTRLLAYLRSEVGLIPEVYVGLKLLFVLTLAAWIIHQCFAHLRFRQNLGQISAMHLRNELWKWSGSEQRMVSKQLRKNRTTS